MGRAANGISEALFRIRRPLREPPNENKLSGGPLQRERAAVPIRWSAWLGCDTPSGVLKGIAAGASSPTPRVGNDTDAQRSPGAVGSGPGWPMKQGIEGRAGM